MSGKMFDILGLYYDGKERFLQEVPTKLKFSVGVKVTHITNNGLSFRFNATSEGKNFGEFTTNGIDLLKLCTDITPNFFVHDNYGRAAVNEKLKVVVTTNEGIVIDGNDNTTNFAIHHYINELISNKRHVPLEFVLHFEVQRTTNVEGRHNFLNQKRNNLNPEQYFQKVLAVGFSQSTTGSSRLTSYYARRNAFSGEFKARLFALRPEVCVFAIEYLYGKKFRKNSTYRQIFDQLAALPFNDFGIRDVQVLQKLLDVLDSTGHSVETLQDKLTKIGLKPATDLRRWLKPVQTITTGTNDLPF